MATQAQTTANRQNAQKSTGPRTTEGKAAVSQNAVKHGLFTRCDVIYGESQDEFDCHHDRILAELAPAGPIESIFAERIVTLSWRLKRAERIQNKAIDAMTEDYMSSALAKLFPSNQQQSQTNPGTSDADLTLGYVAIDDFSGAAIFDRLQLYERRIELSLYHAMLEFQRISLSAKIKRQGHVDEETEHRLLLGR
jgi:hypothetical protein